MTGAVKRLVSRPGAPAPAPPTSPARRRAGLLGATGLVLVGLLGLNPSLGRRLEQESYDLLFRLRPDSRSPVPGELVIIRMDDDSRRSLGQRKEFTWNRALHARLIDTLAAGGARTVVFDLLLAEETDEDPSLAQAIARHRQVVLSANLTRRNLPSLGAVEEIEPPAAALAQSAAGVGLLNVVTGRDGVTRRLLAGRRSPTVKKWTPSLSWVAASLEGRNLAESQTAPRANLWLNYYGPANTLPSITYADALKPEAATRFRDKIVVVGANFEVDFPGTRKDTFPTPYGAGRLEMPGLELHATSLLNLMRGEWLERLPAPLEAGLVVAFGILLGLGLPRLRPIPALALAALLAALLASASLMLGWSGHRWWSWLVPVGLQIPAGLAWAWASHLLLLGHEKELLRRSLSTYLSPHVVDQIIARPETFRLGGDIRRVAILFTDITDFSRISQRMAAQDLVHVLNDYYETAIRCVHEADGMVLGILGDGLFAVWNAPVDQDQPESQALRAALQLAGRLEAFEHRAGTLPLRTRIGLHSGEACVGNFGSSDHFAYTAIGDAVNLASRLNGLNKHLGTGILVSRAFQDGLPPSEASRPLGWFRFQGFDEAVEVLQPLPHPPTHGGRPGEDDFADGLQHFAGGRLPEAQAAFQRAAAANPADGAARFYVAWLRDLAPPPQPSLPLVVELNSK